MFLKCVTFIQSNPAQGAICNELECASLKIRKTCEIRGFYGVKISNVTHKCIV